MAVTIPTAMQTALDRCRITMTRDQHGNWRTEDAVIAQYWLGKKQSVFVDRSQDKVFNLAMAAHREHDAEMTKRSGFSTDPVKVVTVTGSVTEAVKKLDKTPAKPQPIPPPAALAHKARVTIEADEADIEFDDVELDNTGQRERNRMNRKEPKRTRKVSMFQSAAEVLVKNPNIGREALAVQAKVAATTAKQCQIAWRDYLAALDKAGCLTAAGKRLIPTGKIK